MSQHCTTVKSETMEQQSKVSRSAARHLRRKKLVAARRKAEENCQSEIDVSEIKQRTSVEKNATNETSNSCLKLNSKITSKYVENRNEVIDPNRSQNVAIFLNNTNDVCKYNQKNDLLDFNTGLSKDSLIENKTNSEKKEKNNPVDLDCDISINSSVNIKLSKPEMDSQEKSREQIKAEREAKKAAKAAAKSKGKAQDKPKLESSSQPNKTEKSEKSKSEKSKPEKSKVDKPKTLEKENACQINSKSETSSSTSPLSTKQTVAARVSVEDKTKLDGKQKLEDKTISDAPKTEEKSKAELRAERRAKQEAQRAAKQASVIDKKKIVKPLSEKVVSKEKSPLPVNKEESVKKIVTKSEVKDNPHQVNLFKHLYINRKNISQLINRSNVNIHPAILRLGVQYAEKVIVGSNARCVALLAGVKQLIRDYERPSQADFTRGLETSLQESINYLNFCRPSAVSMQNALKHLKWQMSTLPSTVPDEEAKCKLENAIDTYIQEQILLADKAISNAIQKKILNEDVILTYGFSSLIHKILCDAYTAGKKFRVVVVDGRPWLEGKELLRRLIKHGIDCSYILINALSFIMPQVSKVFLGAHAILANGAVMSRVGTAQVALIAKAFNVPVLVACETHKSCERVQTDSIVYNEIGDPDQLVKNTSNGSKKSCISNWKTRKTLNLLNITYDVTPADLVTAVVTELAILPCTSVPVILRIKPSEM